MATGLIFLGYTNTAPVIQPIFSTDVSVETTGEVTMPRTPAFFAYLSSADNNVTGNSAQYFLGTNTALTEVFDQGADFNTNGTFTAPVNGRYRFESRITTQDCTIATQSNLRLVTSNLTILSQFVRAASADNLSVIISAIMDMDSGDTARVSIQNNGEAANTNDIALNNTTWFSGSLEC